MEYETNGKVKALRKELRSVKDAIAALEYFAASRSSRSTSSNGYGDIQAFTESLKAQRAACDTAIAEYERLAQDRQKDKEKITSPL